MTYDRKPPDRPPLIEVAARLARAGRGADAAAVRDAAGQCDHKFTFIRTEEKNIGYTRDPLYLIQDVFFCERCLAYQRVDVRKERPSDMYGGQRNVVENLV